ncbi:MAG TPA: DUF2130 domain-containing protein [Steroidobacteraceae bacterium]|nr:DUF2130 domain-containing protein [Steroidobacteraceae bacterium]
MSSQEDVVTQLLLPSDTLVTCPKCQARFSLEEGFARHALAQFEHSTEGALEEVRKSERAQAERRAQQLAAQRDSAMRAENAQLQQLLKEQAATHERAIQETRALTETRARALVATDRQALEQEIADKNRQLSELRSSELALRREKSALTDRAAALELEVARKLDAGRTELESKVRIQERERAELEKAELQKRLDDMTAQLSEAQRKGSTGSQQLQGEVLELSLQKDLEAAFPLDVIEEVRKGVRGGDVIQRVTTRGGQTAGVLLWEAKRAKDWSSQWVSKLKEDLRGCNADVGVLVTMGTAFPKDWEEGQLFGLSEEVWVTSWTTALQLATVLRAGVLDLHKQRIVSAGKGEKMEAVYDYLTSSQFAHKLKAIYASFYRMRQELESEKSQTLQRWARREKQLQSGIAELVGVAGDIQGLAQQDLPLLEIEGANEPQAPAAAGGEAPQLGLRMDP